MSFILRYPAFISVFLLAASFAASFYFYRATPLPALTRYLLVGLKTAAVFLLAFLFLQPTVLGILSYQQKPVNILLIDNSRSNTIEETKLQQIRGAMLNLRKSPGDEVKVYTFSEGAAAAEMNLELKSDGFETNLKNSLDNVREELPDRVFGTVTIVSDGIFNAGGNPLYTARTFDCPFLTIPVGDTAQRNDVVISNVFYNDKALTDAVNVVKVELNSYGFQQEKIKVSLMREGSLIAEGFTEGNEGEVTFELRETEPGTVRYSVFAADLPGEITFKNNKEDFLIKYLENKVNILYISAGPGYDNAAITDVLNRIKNYSVTIRTQKSGNDFYEGSIDYKLFSELSAVLLRGFPSLATSPELVSTLAAKVKEFNVPLVFMADKATDYRKIDRFGELIPFSVAGPGGEQSTSLQSTGSEGAKGIFDQISSAPTIFRNVSSVIQKPGTEVLLIDKISREPVLITRFTPGHKAAAFLGYGLWNWRLNSRADYERILEKFIVELINVSLTKERKSRFIVTPSKKIFDYSEDVTFTAEIYDDNFNSIRDGVIKAKIISGQKVVKDGLLFSPAENKYWLNAGRLGYGDYRIAAESEVGGTFYAKDEARFLADTNRLEFKVTKSNFESLRLLSDNTGGKLLTGEAANDSIDNFLTTHRKREYAELKKFVNFNLWENKYFLLTAILLFAAEWVLRKRNNLP
jgi:hypothetical protein